MSRVKTAIPTDFPLLGAPWLMSGLAAVVSRSGLLGSMAPISNLIISNVPGSPVPLYFAGAQLASFYPVSIVVHSMALNVTVQSYAGRLDYGLIACRRALPDVTDLGDYLLAEHELLLAKAKEAASVMAPIADQRSSAAPQQAVSRGASAERKASAPRRAKAAPAKAAKAAAPTR
jgi:diacylglycerol O-acyltransferase / wax synthase